jgi:hypothetical protein
LESSVPVTNETVPTYKIEVNGRIFDVDLPRLTGRQIRALAYIEPGHDLILEGAELAEDKLLSDEDSVDLTKAKMVIYTRPPTAFGCNRRAVNG